MKTADEILSEKEYDVHYYGGGRRHVLSAMDEYAREVAMAALLKFGVQEDNAKFTIDLLLHPSQK